jgi:phosphoribosylformylglycinamidine synthase
LLAERRLFEFVPEGTDLTHNFRKLLASPGIASKHWIFEQYDSMVRTNTLIGPGAGDAAVMRIKGTDRALALATDGNSRWCQLDPRLGAMHAVAEAARNVACAGAQPVAATNCLNFGNPEKPEVMWQFSETIDGIAQACTALGTPITGGNVSFYNETLGKSIYPTPIIGILGMIEDASRAVPMGVRQQGDVFVLLDGWDVVETVSRKDIAVEFSSSEYVKSIAHRAAGAPPSIDLVAEKNLQRCLVALAAESVIRSAHDVSDGGLAITVAESCFASGDRTRNESDVLSAQIELTSAEPPEATLFGERGARAVVSVARALLARVLESARQYNVGAREIGQVTREGEFRIQLNGQTIIREQITTLRDDWASSLELALQTK